VEDDRPNEKPGGEDGAEYESFEDLARKLFKVPKVELAEKLKQHKIAPKSRD